MDAQKKYKVDNNFLIKIFLFLYISTPLVLASVDNFFIKPRLNIFRDSFLKQ